MREGCVKEAREEWNVKKELHCTICLFKFNHTALLSTEGGRQQYEFVISWLIGYEVGLQFDSGCLPAFLPACLAACERLGGENTPQDYHLFMLPFTLLARQPNAHER